MVPKQSKIKLEEELPPCFSPISNNIQHIFKRELSEMTAKKNKTEETTPV
jgi:hypothetical protein